MLSRKYNYQKKTLPIPKKKAKGKKITANNNERIKPNEIIDNALRNRNPIIISFHLFLGQKKKLSIDIEKKT
ncbi:hypothetical protein CVP05_06775 [Conservatibacter flavescens]|uniref:Uncharacterized protein n=1 Tax=Conservatibacter flavescens TaxID=28161 RepID=A0A2M8S2A9_9PAST|nr:hypothetical protein CVP05_06775 [Conservatibacter flavescens]